MTTTDKIFYVFMFFASICILALLLSLVGCAGTMQSTPAQISECDPLSVTVTERSLDPCELEYWEDQQFAIRGGGCG